MNPVLESHDTDWADPADEAESVRRPAENRSIA
jgi:hypothetical protein